MMKRRQVELEVKATKSDGTFSGYASVFGNLDSHRDVVAAGAFAETLKEMTTKGRTFPILWHHDMSDPVGVWTKLEEDDKGLYGEGELWMDDAPRARIAHRGLKSRSVTGLSIGYRTRESDYDEVENVRTLKKLDLVEISIVTAPSNEEARADAVKATLEDGALPTLKQFEGFLREAGFSKSQAAAIAGRGLSHLLRGEPAGDGETVEAIKALSARLDGFKL